MARSKSQRISLRFKNDLPATRTADMSEASRSAASRHFNLIRKMTFPESMREAKAEIGEHGLDGSYFGAKGVRGKRGREAAGKTPVFGLLKRGGKVFVTMVPNRPKGTLTPMVRGLMLEKSTVCADGWKAYDGLILNVMTITESFIARTNPPEARAMPTGRRASGASRRGGSPSPTDARLRISYAI